MYLVRHCDYDNPRNILPGRLPVPLSNLGVEQAKKLATDFSDKNITKIYSSAVLRCKQTAEIISQATIPLEYDPRLLEVFSAYQGHWNEGALDWSVFFKYRHELGGEGYIDVQNRIVSFFNEVSKKDQGDIIVCTHGDPLYLLYLHLTGKPLPPATIELGVRTNLEYQPKGSVRIIELEGTQYNVQPITT
jgi:broad specificity phosphatase PhoE